MTFIFGTENFVIVTIISLSKFLVPNFGIVSHIVEPGADNHKPFADQVRADPDGHLVATFADKSHPAPAAGGINAESFRRDPPRTVKRAVHSPSCGQLTNLLQNVRGVRVEHNFCAHL